MNILVVEKEGVAVVAVVLAEGLAVIAIHDPDRVLFESARAQAFDQRTERGVAVVQGVAVLIDLGGCREGAGLRRGIRVVAGDGQVGEEEGLAARQGVDP